VAGGETRVLWSPEAVVLMEPVFDGEATCELLVPQWREVGVRTEAGEFWSRRREVNFLEDEASRDLQVRQLDVQEGPA